MNLYFYEGPVLKYGQCVDTHWESSTYAVSKEKARSNLTYQYKKKYGYLPQVKITLPGNIVLIEED